MSSLVPYFVVVVLLVNTSPSVSLASSSDCPSCAQMKRNLSSLGQTDMVEAVKLHILHMLHLKARPNLTQPVPHTMMLNAINKSHVGHVTKDGSVEIRTGGGAVGNSAPQKPPSEIICFAEEGGAADSVTFDVWQDSGGASVVERANVWIFVKILKGNRAKGKVTLRLLQRHSDQDEDEHVSEKTVYTHRSGWHVFPVPRSIQNLLDSGRHSLRLHISCPLCLEAGASPVLAPTAGRDESHRPFLMVALRAQEGATQHRVRRGLDCDGEIRVCCKRQFYVDFKDIGWNDWIIAPSGYHANFCDGDCPIHMEALNAYAPSFHSAVISHYRLRGSSPFQSVKSCCVPTRLRAMSMLYYNEEHKIIKTDVQNMIVEECGCT